jgi:DNA-binding NarL/FixJ family response regulator
LGWPLEVTVAVFWQSNPMICTYTTLLTFPAREGGGVPMEARARGWRVLVVEPDGAVRRALVHWLRRSERVALVLGVPMPMVARRAKDWHLVLANHNQPMAALRAFADRAGAGGQPARLLTHGLFRDSDAIFASVSGVARGYFLRRLPPSDLLEPVLGSLPEGPSGEVETDRMVRRYFQECLEPRDGRSEPHPTLLTARETDVLELLRRGLVDKEIAGELGLSVWTVHSHLKRIFAKLGVRTRTEAVVRHLQK